MAFIERKNPIVLNIKLTSKGREQLSGGNLDFKYFTIGDSEIDYVFNSKIKDVDPEYTAFNSNILRAVDKNPSIVSFVPKSLSGTSFNELNNIPIAEYIIENQVESLGFFTNDNTEFITDSNHVKQPDCMIDMSTVSGGNLITLEKASTYGASGEEPAVGDILFVRWTHGENTTGFLVNNDYPTPNLFYKIIEISGGSLGSGSVTVVVDRNIPDFNTLSLSGVYAGAMIYYNEISFTGDTISQMSAPDYLDESVLSFLENSQSPTIIFPYWNMSIIYTEEIAGVQAGNLKFTQFKNKEFGGFISYIQNQSSIIKKMGVIHYTNSSPANVYGEGFLLDTPTVDIPTIMWHKSLNPTLGTTLSPIGGQQILEGLNINYYDLGDSDGFIVGKMFPDLKIFVIEDQELLFAMSYKSNRSWTLPDYDANGTTIIPPLTGGTTVTWATPTNNAIATCIVPDSLQYCHSAQGWTSFENTLSLGNICDAGYRVSICNYDSSSGVVGICAYDYVTGASIETNSASSGANTSTTVSLEGINHETGYYFSGNIYTGNSQ